MFRPTDQYNLVIVLSLILFISCSKEENISSGTPCSEPQHLGRFSLIEDSKSFLSYENVSRVIFMNEAGDSLSLSINGFNLNFVLVSEEAACPEDNAILAIYQYSSEMKYLKLENESLNLHFEIRLKVEPSLSEVEDYKLADIVSVSLQDPMNSHTYYRLLTFYANNRERPDAIVLSEEYFDTVELNDKIFNEAYLETKSVKIENANISFETYFNKEYGLIGFNDLEGNLWVFDRFE